MPGDEYFAKGGVIKGAAADDDIVLFPTWLGTGCYSVKPSQLLSEKERELDYLWDMRD